MFRTLNSTSEVNHDCDRWDDGMSLFFRVADYFAQLNNKMGGDLKKIQIVGEYMVEIWKAVGMDMTRVEVQPQP